MGLSRLLIVAVLTVGVLLVTTGGRLAVTGYATSVDFDAKWSAASCQEYHTWPSLTPNGGDYGEYLGKNVGSTSISGVWSDTLTLTSSGTYPSYAVKCVLKYKNTGSNPIQAESLSLEGISGLSGCSSTSSNGSNTFGCAQLTAIVQGGLASTCLSPGQEHQTILFSHVEQPAAESALMRYRAKVNFAQCQGPPGPGGEPDCELQAVYNGKTVANGKTTYSYTLSGGGVDCEDIDYFKMPVKFNAKKTSNGGCVYAETHPSNWTYDPLTSTNPDFVRWRANSNVGSGPGSWTFTFTLKGTNIPTEQVQAEVYIDGERIQVGSVTVPRKCSS